MVSLLLLMRQHLATQDVNSGFTLQEQEMLENTSWEELVKENRKNL